MQRFSLKPTVYFDHNAIEYLREVKGSRALIVTDGMMKQLGLADKVANVLAQNYITSNIFSEILPDPDLKMIVAGMKALADCNPDIIIAIGGGSVIDTTKGILYSFWKMQEANNMPFEKPNFIAIPTTSGTGSEVTAFSVIRMGDGKIALVDDWMIPDVAILDPEFVKSVPAKITADTGMDVLCHALEAYVSTNSNDMTDAMSEKVVKLVFENLYTAYKDGANETARAKMHNASCMAGIAFTNASLGITHSLAHAIGGVFHIPHGRANALLMSNVIAYNADLKNGANNEAARKYAYLAKLIGLPSDTPLEGTISLIIAIENLKKMMEVPSKISEMGIEESAFEMELDKMSHLALNDGCTVTNPTQPSIENLKNIYRQTYK